MIKRRALAAVTIGAMLSLAGSLAYAAGTIDITDPADGSTLTGKSTIIRGTVGASETIGGARTLTYLLDVSSSTGSHKEMDCNGDGVADARDNYNGDPRNGDVLDCEIAAVQSLNKSLSGISGLQVGVAAFGNRGRYADMGSGRFVDPAAADTSGNNRVRVVTNSITQGRIGKYTAVPNLSTGTSFNSALDAVVDGYASVSGEKWVFMVTDGESSVTQATLDALQKADIKVRAFAVGNSAACGPTTALTRIATTTGETCVEVTDPTDLTAAFSGASSDVDSVSVAITGPEGYFETLDVTGSVNALGDWTTPELSDLAAGSYTATSTATFTDGTSAVDSVTFTVSGKQAEPTTSPTSMPSPSPTPSATPTPTPTYSQKRSHPKHRHTKHRNSKPGHSQGLSHSPSDELPHSDSPESEDAHSDGNSDISEHGKYPIKDYRGGLASTGS